MRCTGHIAGKGTLPLNAGVCRCCNQLQHMADAVLAETTIHLYCCMLLTVMTHISVLPTLDA